MTEPRIPDRSAEPALQKSLDHGAQSRTAAHSEDVARDAGKGPQEDTADHADPESQQPTRSLDSRDDSAAEPDDEEVETMTGVPSSSEDLSQM